MSSSHHPAAFATVVSACLAALLLGAAQAGETIDFNRDIRPILSDTCFKCHGPDEGQRQAELRLDTEQGLLGEREGKRIVVPGDVSASELFRRITTADSDERMPPVDSKLSLTEPQIALIRRWIEEGARWRQHWAFEPPRRAPLPMVRTSQWCRNAIDRFVLARLEQEEMRPSAEADRATLIRRVTLDLTGLPPSVQEVDAFLADRSPDAYERLVDRLLQSPAYGERMALVWLDAARYADTSGYQNDGPREMWRWRDWVIDAYNDGLPFDQFTMEQLAGDLLPQPTLDQRIATGFHRNHRGNAEGGVIPEEFQVEYVVDRVETTGTVWLGLTIGCARCHEHKFDPISQREFYQLFAYFNNIPENGRAIKEGNSPPYVKAPTPEQERRLAALAGEILQAEQLVRSLQDELATRQQAWENELAAQGAGHDWMPTRGQVAHFALDEAPAGEQRTLQFIDGSPSFAPGLYGSAARFDGHRCIDAGDVAKFGYFDKFSIAAWVRPDVVDAGTVVSRMTDAEQADGYYIQIVDGHVQVNLVKRWLDDCIRVATDAQLPTGKWTHLLVTYDGSRLAKGITVYLDGTPVPTKVHYDFLNQSFSSEEPLRIGGGGGPAARFRGLIDEVRLYDRRLKPSEAAILATPETVGQILARAKAARSGGQQQKLAACYLDQCAPAHLSGAHQQLVQLQEQREQFVESIPTVMVMEELPQPRKTHMLLRGEYDKLGEPVASGTPACLPALPADAPENRLGLAQWLTDPEHPLTARVAVNRYWQTLFGEGLVRTAEDFGVQGERPSHPELLDWLATEFVARGWDVKALQRLIVTSATYRQSSQVSDERLSQDPDNRWLGRAPRLRLPAEMVRDQALAAAGLLTAWMGGPSVKPYQPDELWKDIATDGVYDQAHGASLYRRGMYTYWKRTVMPPAMAAFDSTSRETCVVRLRRTNTPLQALTLMNDVTFVEAARALAQHTFSATPATDERLTRIFRAVLARAPSERELAILRQGLATHLAHYQAAPEAARELVTVGEYPPANSADDAELAAYTTLASLILNLDEAVTRQ